jgi:hypothetical protein
MIAEASLVDTPVVVAPRHASSPSAAVVGTLRLSQATSISASCQESKRISASKMGYKRRRATPQDYVLLLDKIRNTFSSAVCL